MDIRLQKIMLCIITVINGITGHKTNMMEQTLPPQQQESSSVKMVIFDLDGVLLETSRGGITKHILGSVGLGGMISFAFDSIRGHNPKEHMFQFLDEIDASDDSDIPYKATDPSGGTIPNIMSRWLAGTPGYDSAHVIQHINANINEYINSKKQRRSMRAIAEGIFDPDVRSHNTHALKSGNTLLKQLQRDYTCEFAILSNYDTTCFAHVYNKPELQPTFSRFSPERIFISADMRRIKPDPMIYYMLCESCGIDPSECLFIDDQAANVEAARNMGMKAVLFDPKHIKRTYKEIYSYLDEK